MPRGQLKMQISQNRLGSEYMAKIKCVISGRSINSFGGEQET